MRAALYARVSTEEQVVHGFSIDAQKQLLSDWATKNNATIVDYYIDEGISARKPAEKRPELMRLLADVKSDLIDVIVFCKLDRWFRNIKEYYKTQDILDKHNVTWQTIQEDYETITASGRLKVNIMLAVAQDEADRTSERIKTVFDHKRANGKIVGGRPPYGYVQKDGKYIINKEKEEIVHDFFDKFMENANISSTLDYILEKHGVNLTRRVAHNFLNNSAYYGITPVNTCEPYITEQQHEKIESLRYRQQTRTKQNRTYLFTGLAVCSNCGRKLYVKRHVFNGREYLSYTCPARRDHKQCEGSAYVNQNDIEKYLLDTLDAKLKEYEIEYVRSESEEKRDNSSRIASLKAKQNRTKDLYINGLIGMDDLKQKNSEIEQEISNLEKQQIKITYHNRNAVEAIASSDWRSVYLIADEKTKRAFWLALIDRIYVSKNREISYAIRK